MKIWGNHKALPLFFIFLLIGLSSCDSLKKVQEPTKPTTSTNEEEELDEIQGKRVYNPETGDYEVVTDVTGELDTIVWTEPALEEVVPPITSDATQNGGEAVFDEETELLFSYNLVLALPFLADRYNAADNKIDRRSIPALNFYEGAKMAFDVLSGEGVNLEVSVLDTRASEGSTIQLTNNYEAQTAHLIIGTFRNSTARAMAEFAKNNSTPFVSPIFPHQNLTNDNPFFIQLNPSAKTHAEAIMGHAKNKFQPDQIVVFGRNIEQEQELMQYYLDAHFAIEGSTNVDTIQLVTIDKDTMSIDDFDFEPYMNELSSTAFIIASSNQSFVYAMLRNLDLKKEDHSIVVYGQPRWKNFTQIGYQYYETMNVHITSDAYLNPDNFDVQSFKEGFYNKFGMPPTTEAFKGYDTALFFGRMLKEFGTGFKGKLDQNAKDGLHTRFDIQRAVTGPLESVEGADLNRFDQFMNKHLNILEFTGYQFRKAD